VHQLDNKVFYSIKYINIIREILWLYFLGWCCLAMTFNTVTCWHRIFRVRTL